MPTTTPVVAQVMPSVIFADGTMRSTSEMPLIKVGAMPIPARRRAGASTAGRSTNGRRATVALMTSAPNNSRRVSGTRQWTAP